MKKLDEFIYATQYYRSPTPLEDEWDYDLTNLGKYNLNTIQIRINWRNNERREDEYDFSDIDKLLALAEKHHKKVIMKFLLECAPQYIFDKYDANRIGPKGEILRGGYHGAFYGGWMPCFSKDIVRERMAKFVRKVTERYSGNPNIIMWNAWNEPRNRPIEECFCDDCKRRYGKHLKDKYQSIENLNKFYGAAEDSFEHISLPSTPHGYWDTFEFKKFKSEQAIFDNLRLVYDTIREIDKDRPIVSHVGYTSAFQFTIGDCINDDFVSKAVDYWGTSVPCDSNMSTKEARLDFAMLNDYLQSICKDYLLYELYPGLGSYKYSYDTNWDIKYKLFTSLGSGAKGINYWQYRSERVGHENDCAGLARSDGSPREILNEVKSFGDIVNNISKDVIGFYKKQSDIAIVFDYDSSLLSEIEDSCGPDYKFDMYWWILYYRNAHAGFYRLMKRNNYDVDYIQSSNIKDIHKYKVIYMPYYAMIKEDVIKELVTFVSNGGILLADEGFGLRDLNTWVNPYDIKCHELFKGRLLERRKDDRVVVYKDKEYLSKGYHSVYNVSNSESIATFKDGSTSIQKIRYGKGYTYLFGFSLGYDAYLSNNDSLIQIFEDCVRNTNIKQVKYSDYNSGLEVKQLVKNDESYYTFLNSSDEERIINFEETILESYGDIQIKSNKIVVSPFGCGFIKLKI